MLAQHLAHHRAFNQVHWLRCDTCVEMTSDDRECCSGILITARESSRSEWAGFVGAWTRYKAEDGTPAVLKCAQGAVLRKFISSRTLTRRCEHMPLFSSALWLCTIQCRSRLCSVDEVAMPSCARREAKGLRCFRPCGHEAFEQINVYSADNGGCKQRESDGNFEKNWYGAGATTPKIAQNAPC